MDWEEENDLLKHEKTRNREKNEGSKNFDRRKHLIAREGGFRKKLCIAPSQNSSLACSIMLRVHRERRGLHARKKRIPGPGKGVGHEEGTTRRYAK